MAVKNLSTRVAIIGRGAKCRGGSSAVDKSAYISRTTMYSEYDGTTYYPKYTEDLVHNEVMLPVNAPAEYSDPSVLWNSVEMRESKSAKAQLARSYKINLPNEWSYELAIAGRQITEEYREGREKVMEYKDFVEQVKEQIQDFLPEKFADATVSVHQVVKNNDCVLDGLTIRTEESNISPTVYLNPYFEQIQDGAEMDDVLGQIAATYQAHYIDHDMDVSAVTDFDNVKDKIVCKLINEEANRQFLEDKPYTKVEDLAVVYQILMDKNAEGTATITITDNLMERYGITLEDLHEQALLNMDVLQPYSFKGMSETIIEMMAGDIARDNGMDISEAREMASQMIPDVPDTMFVLTNDTKVNGAAAILNDDTRQEIADKVGDFYVLPSSVHETLIIPKDAGMELRDLEQMVQEVNQTQVAPQERLSDHVYEYDAKEHELFRSDRAEEHTKQKEEKRDEKKERPSLKERLAEKKNDVMKMDADRKQPTADKKKEAMI